MQSLFAWLPAPHLEPQMRVPTFVSVSPVRVSRGGFVGEAKPRLAPSPVAAAQPSLSQAVALPLLCAGGRRGAHCCAAGSRGQWKAGGGWTWFSCIGKRHLSAINQALCSRGPCPSSWKAHSLSSSMVLRLADPMACCFMSRSPMCLT